MYVILCHNCKKAFTNIHSHTKFCSRECKRLYWESQRPSYNKAHNTDLSTSFIGAIAEAKVIADLAHKGFEVYKGFWDTSSDLVIMKNGEKFSVQVKTAHDQSGKVTWGGASVNSDILAMYIYNDGSIIYNPELPSEFADKQTETGQGDTIYSHSENPALD